METIGEDHAVELVGECSTSGLVKLLASQDVDISSMADSINTTFDDEDMGVGDVHPRAQLPRELTAGVVTTHISPLSVCCEGGSSWAARFRSDR